MADKRILTSRRWHVDGKWFAPREFLEENFSSVVYCNYIDTSSSAGDWSGLILQRLGRKLYATIFSQENSYPGAGFDITTAEQSEVVIENFHDDVSYSDLFGQLCSEMIY